MDTRALLRKRLLEEIYDRMTDEEKKLFVHLSAENKSNEEIRQALAAQSQKLDEIKRGQQSFIADYSSNILANASWDALLWVGKNILRNLRF